MIAHQAIRLISFTFLFVLFWAASAHSAPKDKPMPLSKNNIDLFYKHLTKEIKKMDPGEGTEIDRLIKVYKVAMTKTGYNLDKTLRYLFLNVNQVSGNPGTIEFWQVMGPAYIAAMTNPDEALKKGLIAQKTFDLVTLSNEAGEMVSDDAYEYIRVAMDCQKDNGNVCPMPKFIELLVKRNLLPPEVLNIVDDESYSSLLTTPLTEKGGFRMWGIREWILRPDGRKIDSGISPEHTRLTFIVNTRKIEAARSYPRVFEEERRSMTSK